MQTVTRSDACEESVHVRVTDPVRCWEGECVRHEAHVLRCASSAGGSHGMRVGAHGGGRCGCEPQLLGESVSRGGPDRGGVIFSSHMITKDPKTPDLEQVPSPTTS